MKKFIVGLVLGLMFVACNYGLVDVQENHKTCYNTKRVIGRDSIRIDSVAFECGDSKITTPFDDMLKSPY